MRRRVSTAHDHFRVRRGCSHASPVQLSAGQHGASARRREPRASSTGGSEPGHGFPKYTARRFHFDGERTRARRRHHHQKARRRNARRATRSRSSSTGVTSGAVPDYQASALLMAILLRGMSAEETACADRRDGPLGRPRRSQRHSRASRSTSTARAASATRRRSILAPLAAACGVPVPMMSGRGLGHTGGTLDKLEAIPGFRVDLSLDGDEGGARRRSAAP